MANMQAIKVHGYKGSQIRTYPSGVDIISDSMSIYIEINLLGQMVAEWKKNNPDIDFESYTQEVTDSN